jgi:hypothetical protein
VTPLAHKYQLEIGGNIFFSKGYWHYTIPKVGGVGSVDIGGYWIGYHTHPEGGLVFSNRYNNYSNDFNSGDADWVSNNQKDLYLGVLINNEVNIGVCEVGNCENRVGTKKPPPPTPPSRIIE